jgi:L-lactate dehydrogenase
MGVSTTSVEAMVIGEHGTSEVFLWSGARVGGMRAELAAAGACADLADVRKAVEQDVLYANITIIEGIGASQLGIGMVSARIAEIVLRDERAVVPIGVFNPKFGATLSTPGILGRSGVSRILEPAMTDEERQALQRSAASLKAAKADRRADGLLVEQRPSQLDMTRHPNSCVALERFVK